MKLLLDTAFGFGIVLEILAYQLLYKRRSLMKIYNIKRYYLRFYLDAN
ncbi:hypothetical protein QT971_07490 [Microcoleus sp. herbarium19]